MSSAASSLGPTGSGFLHVPSLQIGVRPMARVGRYEHGKSQGDLQQPPSAHGAERLPAPAASRRAPGSLRGAAAPLSAPRRRGPALPPPVPRAGLLPPSPGAAPTPGGPCQLQQTNRRGGRDIQGIRMLKLRGPHSRAQPARRLRVAQLLRVSEDRWVHSWLQSPGPRQQRLQPTPRPPGRSLQRAPPSTHVSSGPAPPGKLPGFTL